MADIILLVTQLELTSLRNAVRILLSLDSEPGLAEKVKVVMNRVGGEDGEITLKKAEETVGRPVYWQLPNDTKAVFGSRNAGVPLIQHAPRCKAHQAIVGLARVLNGKDPRPEPVAAGNGRKTRWW